MGRGDAKSRLLEVDFQDIFVEASEMTKLMAISAMRRIIEQAFPVGNPDRGAPTHHQCPVDAVQVRTDIEDVFHDTGRHADVELILEIGRAPCRESGSRYG